MRCSETFAQAPALPAAPPTRKPVFPTRLRSRRPHGRCQASMASGLITTPVLTELVRLSLSTSSLAGAKTAAGEHASTALRLVPANACQSSLHCLLVQGSHVVGSHIIAPGVPNLLVQYTILCTLLASLGGWVVQFAGFLWQSLFEDRVIQDEESAKVLNDESTVAFTGFSC